MVFTGPHWVEVVTVVVSKGHGFRGLGCRVQGCRVIWFSCIHLQLFFGGSGRIRDSGLRTLG